MALYCPPRTAIWSHRISLFVGPHQKLGHLAMEVSQYLALLLRVGLRPMVKIILANSLVYSHDSPLSILETYRTRIISVMLYTN